MSSSRFPSRTNRAAALIAASSLLALAGAAHAQQAVLPPPSVQAMPGLPANEAVPQAQPAAPVQGLPAGATVTDSAERVRDLAAEAGRDLEALVGDAVTPESEAEQRASAERRRRINVLQDRLEEAKLAKQIYKELNGDSDAADERVAVLEKEKAELERKLAEGAAAPASSAKAPDPLPVVSRVSGAGADMTASILVPYVGEMKAVVGSVLPDGRRVVSVGQSGVVTLKNGVRDTLAFGTSVPSQRPSSAPAGQAGAVGIPVQTFR